MSIKGNSLLLPRIIQFSAIIIFFLIISCEKESSQLPAINIDDALDEGVFEVDSDLISTRINVLNTNSSLPVLANVTNLQKDQDLIFIQDGKLHNIHIYQSDGKLETIIESKGQGPQEFEFIEAFSLDKEKKVVIIYDSRTSKIIHFDYKGNFVEEKKSKLFIRSLTQINGGWLAINAQSSFGKKQEYIFRLNEKLEKSKGIKNQEIKFSNLVADINPFSSHETTILMNEPFSNTVYNYNLETNHFTPEFIVDFGDKSIPDPNNYPTMRKFYTDVQKGDYQGWIRELKIIDKNILIFKYIVFQKNKNSKSKYLLYNKESKQAKLFSSFRLNGLNLPYPKLSIGSELYCIILSDQIEELFNDENTKEEDKIFWKSLIMDFPKANALAVSFRINTNE